MVTMLFGIFSRCDSMGEVCDGMKTLQGNLNYFGFDIAQAKSTAGDGLRERNNEFFQDLYFILLEHFSSILSVSRIKMFLLTNCIYLILRQLDFFMRFINYLNLIKALIPALERFNSSIFKYSSSVFNSSTL